MNFATLQSGGIADKDLVKDGWTDIAIRIRDRIINKIQDTPGASLDDVWIEAFSESDDEKMNEIRARVNTIVTDDKAAEALKPWYRQLCKRPCFHDEYLQSFNNPQHTSSTQTERALSASTKPAYGQMVNTTSSTALFSHLDSKCTSSTPHTTKHMVNPVKASVNTGVTA